MPVYEIELPDGRTTEIEAPEGATDDQVIAFVKSQWESGAFKQAPETKDFSSGLAGLGEAALTMGTGAASSVAGGIAGLAASPFVGTDKAADIVRGMQQDFTYQPRTESGQAILGGVSRPFEAIESGQRYLGDKTLEATGSPALATAAYAAPDVISTLLGLKGIRKIQGDIKLKNPDGTPTRELLDALNEKGIIYDSLDPNVKNKIPAVIPRDIVGGSKAAKQSASQDVLAGELGANGRQRGLAPYQLSNGKVTSDTLANEAIRQGFDEGIVQMIKTTTPDTRKNMATMLNYMERATGDRSLNIRPTDIVGTSVAKRLEFIADKASVARNELNLIAKNNLAGKQIDIQPIVDRYYSALDDLGVTAVVKEGDIKPTLDFNGSIIQADPTSQRMLRQLTDLMASGKPDALRFHNLKRQLDALIDYQKSSKSGIPESGRRVLKGIRATLNDGLRKVDADYARVNDTMSRALSLFDQLDSATASKINVADTLADSRAMGQEMRKLFSNYQTRVSLDNALREIDSVVNEFSRPKTKDIVPYSPEAAAGRSVPKFKDNIYDMAQFANELDRQFGAIARTSLQGTMESAVGRAIGGAATQGTNATMAQMAADAAKRKIDELRNINPYEGYRSMEELLKRGDQ